MIEGTITTGAAAPWRDHARRYGVWLSVGLNVFLVTLVGGHLLHRPPPPPSLDFLSPRVIGSLPAQDAAQVQAVLAQERPRFRASRDRLDDARASLSRAIARTPYDPALVEQRLAEFRERWQEMSDRFTEAMLPVLSGLTPQGRAALVDAAERPRHPSRRHAP